MQMLASEAGAMDAAALGKMEIGAMRERSRPPVHVSGSVAEKCDARGFGGRVNRKSNKVTSASVEPDGLWSSGKNTDNALEFYGRWWRRATVQGGLKTTFNAGAWSAPGNIK
jgi:hypothetical protein